jgi:multidrug resistance efflux pump
LLALLWKGFVCLTLIVGAAGLFGGLGVVLSFIAAGMWLGVPLLGLVASVRRATWQQRRRFLLRAGLCLGGTVAALLVLPAPGTGTAAGVVVYSPHEVIRAEAAGFVDKIHVTSGQRVDRGDVLLTLENRPLVNQAKQIALRLRACELQIRQHTAAGDHAAAQAETSRLRAVRNEHRERLQQIEALRVRAPHAGQVVGRDLDQLIGTYLRPGDEILVIGNEDRKELRLLIDEGDFETFRHRLGGTIEYRASPSHVLRGTLVKINPQATQVIEHQALSANHGGPLATTSDREVDDESRNTQWITPHFEAVVVVDRGDSPSLRSGQRVIARLTGGVASVGADLTRRLKNLLSRGW